MSQSPPNSCPFSGQKPNTTSPLLRDGLGEDSLPIQKGLGPLLGLVGTWNSPPPSLEPTVLANGFFVMPLPQDTAANNFILSTFPYYEEITFAAIDQGVTNRSGSYDQNNFTLFYEERVFFGGGDQANQLVHAENGLLFNIEVGNQMEGPLEGQGVIPSPPAPSPLPIPPLPFVKQVSVPHGNSILAPGIHQQINGAPVIPDVSTLPTGDGVDPSYFIPFNNPPYGQSDLILNPNIKLQYQLGLYQDQVQYTDIFQFSSQNLGGGVQNIAFETLFADVLSYDFTYWLEHLDDNTKRLQYSQTIAMRLANNPEVVFYHITANTLTNVPFVQKITSSTDGE